MVRATLLDTEIHSLLLTFLNLSTTTPANYIYPQISDDEEFEDDHNNINDEEEATVETAAALISLHKAPFVFNSSNSTSGAISSKRAGEGKLGKSRFSREIISQGDEPMCIEQTAAEESIDLSTAVTVARQELGGNRVTHQADKIGAVEHPVWFTDNELNGFLNVEKVGEDVIEVVCACTSPMHGHYQGKLRVFRDGGLCIDCKCTPGCGIVDATPWQFVSHTRARRGPGQWPRLIWVHNRQGVRISIDKTPFMRYFRIAGMRVEKKHKVKFHKDEFMKCSKCGLERRFKLSNAVRCRAYHDATLVKSWTCSMHPFRKIDCNTEAERATRKLVRGCRNGTCCGCHLCSCTGCRMCRYHDCGCKKCVVYTTNS